MESFSRFSSRLDDRTRNLIERGKRIREILKQPQFNPLQVDEQIVLLLAVTHGLFDDISIDSIEDAKEKIIASVHDEMGEFKMQISWDESLSDEDRERLITIAREAIGTGMKKTITDGEE
jgi:F-type H+-transporting ATPase subunit alpha